jgi:hypothetical protein
MLWFTIWMSTLSNIRIALAAGVQEGVAAERKGSLWFSVAQSLPVLQVETSIFDRR